MYNSNIVAAEQKNFKYCRNIENNAAYFIFMIDSIINLM